MSNLALAIIAFKRPDALREQLRLLGKYLADDHAVLVVDNAPDCEEQELTEALCRERFIGYLRAPETKERFHHEALNFAAAQLLATQADCIGLLDHDVFPVRRTRVVPLLEERGFWGLGQSYRGRPYLWPGLCFFARDWLDGARLDFSGLSKDADTGSGLIPLFESRGIGCEDLPKMQHEEVRLLEGGEHSQEHSYERIGDWWHLANLARWHRHDREEERERLFFEMLAQL